MGFDGDFIGFYGDLMLILWYLMGFDSDFIGFYGGLMVILWNLMGFDFMVVLWNLMGFDSNFMGFYCDLKLGLMELNGMLNEDGNKHGGATNPAWNMGYEWNVFMGYTNIYYHYQL